MTITLSVEVIIIAALAIRAYIHFAHAIGKILGEMSEQYGQGELPPEKPNRLP